MFLSVERITIAPEGENTVDHPRSGEIQAGVENRRRDLNQDRNQESNRILPEAVVLHFTPINLRPHALLILHSKLRWK